VDVRGAVVEGEDAAVLLRREKNREGITMSTQIITTAMSKSTAPLPRRVRRRREVEDDREGEVVQLHLQRLRKRLLL
jgi:hypothetical protein